MTKLVRFGFNFPVMSLSSRIKRDIWWATAIVPEISALSRLVCACKNRYHGGAVWGWGAWDRKVCICTWRSIPRLSHLAATFLFLVTGIRFLSSFLSSGETFRFSSLRPTPKNLGPCKFSLTSHLYHRHVCIAFLISEYWYAQITVFHLFFFFTKGNVQLE